MSETVERLIRWGLAETTEDNLIKLTERGMYIGNTMYAESETCREFARQMSEHGFSTQLAVMMYLDGAAEQIDNMTPDEREALEGMV